ncbi:hypothetical protein GCM10023194_05170 [Planotetraspora phitsanulokensis]|uniref:Uncharacterized protein n=1 Tax=Planotetraspora phitsanulokensis TaxID=575192 RepID=A0A8J3U5J8_9ACTN|nr:hypothetical protein [Planotetraspora phitsanulokensis]GII39013.1 hypothetical protein Pph01_40160 [Planotetraspora phitsanulokensis]
MGCNNLAARTVTHEGRTTRIGVHALGVIGEFLRARRKVTIPRQAGLVYSGLRRTVAPGSPSEQALATLSRTVEHGVDLDPVLSVHSHIRGYG